MTVYILGGGPTGLAIADGLCDERINFILLERDAELGGLARTLTWEGVGSHDLGPHKIFTLDEELMKRVEALLGPSQWLTRDKISSIYINGHFLSYPPSPAVLAKVFGIPGFVWMGGSYLLAMVSNLLRRRKPRTFEEDLLGRVGDGLYELLFKPLALKVWGNPQNLDVKLSKGRVQTPSLVEFVARTLGLRRSSQFEALTFRYPSGGLGRLWAAIRERTRANGDFLLDHVVTGLDVDDDRICAIHCLGLNKQPLMIPVTANDFVVSSLPLGVLIRLLGPILPDVVVELARRVITLNDLLLVFLHIDCPKLFPEAWIFVPDSNIPFHRVSEQASFDPSMSPKGSIVCCEVMSNEMRNMSALSDGELIEAVTRGLHEMGFKDWRPLDQRVIRLPKSYPVFRPGFEVGLVKILAHIDALKNLRTLGRQGAFNYIGTLDAMDIGYGFARWFKQGQVENWQNERTRTSHYPVLD
jgi:protoporphyrinogen oxidase